MRDIRRDLKERLESIAQQRSELQGTIDQLIQAENGVKALLREEERRFAASSPPAFTAIMESDSGNGYGAIKQFLLAAFNEKNRPLDKEELKEMAKHTLDFENKSPGRVLHFALVGMQSSGLVHRLKDGRWELTMKQEVAAD